VYITCKGGLVSKPMTSVYDGTEPPPIDASSQTEQIGPGAVVSAQVPDMRVGRQPAVKWANLSGDGSAVAEDTTATPDAVNDASGGGSGPGADSAAGSPVESGATEDKRPAVFKTRSVTYDMTTGSGWAQAPVELTFYPKLSAKSDPNTVVLPKLSAKSDPNTVVLPKLSAKSDPNTVVLPVVITAEKNVQFLANKDRVVERIIFNKNVIGTRKVATPLYVQTSQFFGEKLTVELNTGPKRELEGDISHIFVTEGNVKLESVRRAKERVISRAKLSCERFDYDVATERVYATGPGRIQLNNANVAPVERKPGDKKPRLSGPCYAWVNGFETLTWFTEAMQINAVGKAESVYMSYIPIVDGKEGDTISVTTRGLQANFFPMPDGSNELKTVITWGGILYEEMEKGGNVFKGQDLHYNAETSLVKVTSTEKNDCWFNGARVDWIEYEMDTGDVRAELASAPGALTMPAKEGTKP